MDPEKNVSDLGINQQYEQDQKEFEDDREENECQ
jgi:hypothetical protein